MNDGADPFDQDPFAETAKPKRGRPPKLKPPASPEPDPFAAPTSHLSVLPATDGATSRRSGSRLPKPSLVHRRGDKAIASPAVDDPFAGPSDQVELPPPPKLPDDRRCGLDDPFGPPLRLPFVIVGRDWDGGLSLRVMGIGGVIEQRTLRTTSEERAFAEAEQIAIKHEATLVVGIPSSFTITAIESTIKATAAAVKGGA